MATQAGREGAPKVERGGGGKGRRASQRLPREAAKERWAAHRAGANGVPPYMYTCLPGPAASSTTQSREQELPRALHYWHLLLRRAAAAGRRASGGPRAALWLASAALSSPLAAGQMTATTSYCREPHCKRTGGADWKSRPKTWRGARPNLPCHGRRLASQLGKPPSRTLAPPRPSLSPGSARSPSFSSVSLVIFSPAAPPPAPSP